jgi:hypothetical protein
VACDTCCAAYLNAGAIWANIRRFAGAVIDTGVTQLPSPARTGAGDASRAGHALLASNPIPSPQTAWTPRAETAFMGGTLHA